MLSNKISSVNSLFCTHILVIALVITGVLPRAVVPFWTIVLAVYVLWASLEDSTTFFVRSIPFFIAIPITAGFDSLNMWRILSGLIFLKWLTQFKVPGLLKTVKALFYYDHNKAKPRQIWKYVTERDGSFISLLLLLLAILSVTQALSYILAIKRIIFFINLSLIGIVLHDLIRKNQNFSQRLIRNIAIPTIIVAIVGMVQLATTYFMDIFQFIDFWGGIVERNLFGNVWAETAIKANTWFAYFGNQISLRMFSIFPDTHSFPIFLLLGLPAVMAIALKKVIEKGNSFKAMLKARASMLVIFVPIIFLALILTGTRGIWAAGIASTFWAIFLIVRLRKSNNSDLRGRPPMVLRRPYIQFGYIASYLVIFFLLFGVAYYIFASDQFRVAKSDSALFGKRVKSVINISETSNARRIEIWKDSLRSIIKRPLLGVGIGNFPVVVGEDLARAKAGSSAHNLYLNIAAEMGIPALIFAFWFLWFLLKKVYFIFLKPVTGNQLLETVYFGSAIIYLPWVLIYSLTDVAIFDERAFLLFTVTVAIIFAQKETDRLAD